MEILSKIKPVYWNKYFSRVKLPETAGLQKIFTDICDNNFWEGNESVSGPGSDLSRTESLRNGLKDLFKDFRIKSVLDIPCGDFNWMKSVDFSGIDYFGGDIVEKLIRNNNQFYGISNRLEFSVIDLTCDKLPQVDLVICRDCLVHLPYASIYKALKNIRKSRSRFLLTTSFLEHRANTDIPAGAWRTLNLQERPFNFPPPLLVIDEKCIAGNGEYKDKVMGLWEIGSIKLPLLGYGFLNRKSEK
jgi:SAM-dependent methyltransferase